MFKNDTLTADGQCDLADHQLAGIFEGRGTNSYKITMRQKQVVGETRLLWF